MQKNHTVTAEHLMSTFLFDCMGKYEILQVCLDYDACHYHVLYLDCCTTQFSWYALWLEPWHTNLDHTNTHWGTESWRLIGDGVIQGFQSPG